MPKTPLSQRLIHVALQAEFQGLSSREEAIEFIETISRARALSGRTIYSPPNYPHIWGLKDVTPLEDKAA